MAFWFIFGGIFRSHIIECENLLSSFEGLVIELPFNLKKEWLLICSYNTHRNIS